MPGLGFAVADYNNIGGRSSQFPATRWSAILAARSDDFDKRKRGFGAKELLRMPGPGGKIMHAEIQIRDSIIMLCDEFPEMGARSAQTLGDTPVSIFLYVEDVDAIFKQAVAAGAKELMPVQDYVLGRLLRQVDRPVWPQVADRHAEGRTDCRGDQPTRCRGDGLTAVAAGFRVCVTTPTWAIFSGSSR